jgi:FeS assembly SUF system protein
MTNESGASAPTTVPPASTQDLSAGSSLPSTSHNRGSSSEEIGRLTDEIITALKSVYDPEIPADVYELGLIYKIDIGDDRAITIDMTLTTPNCPSAQELPGMVENAAASVPGVGPVTVNVVWDPPWEPSRMSDEARMVLNMW